MAYMVNGLMAQLRKSVKNTGLPLLPALTNRGKIDFHHDRVYHEEEANRDGNGHHRTPFT